MDLFGNDPNVTVEQRFALVLQERVDALTDEINLLRLQVNSLGGNIQLPTNVICKDIARSSAAAFIKATVTSSNHVKNFIDALDAHERVASYGYFAHPSNRLFEGGDPENGVEDDDENAVTIQALVLFDRTTVAALLGSLACDSNIKRLEIGAVPGAWVGLINHNNKCFTWYLYHIVAGQCGKSVSSYWGQGVKWWEKGKTSVGVSFSANTPGCECFDDIAEGIEDVPVWPVMPAGNE